MTAERKTSDKFPPTSRYHGIEIGHLEQHRGGDTMRIAYLRRRFVPPPEAFALLREHLVTQGERLDNIAALYLGDPEQYWRIADANAAMSPDELTAVVGRRLRITLPAGLPGQEDG